MWMHSRNGPTPAAVVYSYSFLLPPCKQPFLSYAGLIWPQLHGDNRLLIVVALKTHQEPFEFQASSHLKPASLC